ncbi:head-tail adaptor [Bacillus phage Glittering]|uniref:DUF1320 domain-containing protein n=1 Tax=Bacillus phage Glittering TaxID=2884421 RepID=U5PTC7_9CAUD|nr:head-tail adaptor [Bacillus phage Glittering]AGY47205.1 hypothetical protein Glittering_18 [Bacillus phage Glittering]
MYATPEDLRLVMNNLSKQVTDELLTKYIQEASNYIDARLGVAYKTPFLVTPPIIHDITVDLARFFFAEDAYTSQKPNLDEYYIKMKERIDKLINDILSGVLIIDPDVKLPAGFGTTTDGEQIFTLDRPEW